VLPFREEVGILGNVRTLAILLSWLAMPSVASAAGPAAIVFVAPTNDSMPLARFENGALEAGIIKDLGDAIAARAGMGVRYLSLPSARVSFGLNSGQADALCYALPEWLNGEFDWSAPVIDDAEIIVTRADVPTVRTLDDLADERVGTVIAYHYREVLSKLGPHFLRDDSRSMELNIRKIVAGRMKYAIVEKLPFDYALRQNPTNLVRVDLVYSPFAARCAFSRHSKIPFAVFDNAVNDLIADGTVARILAAYR
jgi:ABC-type amino acid transport substrate-binding protein